MSRKFFIVPGLGGMFVRNTSKSTTTTFSTSATTSQNTTKSTTTTWASKFNTNKSTTTIWTTTWRTTSSCDACTHSD